MTLETRGWRGVRRCARTWSRVILAVVGGLWLLCSSAVRRAEKGVSRVDDDDDDEGVAEKRFGECGGEGLMVIRGR